MGNVLENRLARYAATVAILAVIGGLFVQRELLAGDAGENGALGVIGSGSVKVGEPAPDFVLETVDGERVKLSDFRGKTVVLNFWATWCPPCRAEMPDLQAIYEERLPLDDLVVLAVDFEEGAGAVRGFVEEFGLTFPVVLDRDGSVAEYFGIRGLPASFFIDRDGVLRAVTLGPVFGDVLHDGIADADAAGASPGA